MIDTTTIDRERLLNTAEAAEFCRLSIPHFRRMYRTGKAPMPRRLSARLYVWRLGDILDWIDRSVVASGDLNRRAPR